MHAHKCNSQITNFLQSYCLCRCEVHVCINFQIRARRGAIHVQIVDYIKPSDKTLQHEHDRKKFPPNQKYRKSQAVGGLLAQAPFSSTPCTGAHERVTEGITVTLTVTPKCTENPMFFQRKWLGLLGYCTLLKRTNLNFSLI